MADQKVEFVSFNRGLVSKYALARVDLQRMHMSAQVMRNWMPRVFGSMMLRPGLGYTGLGPYNNAVSKCVPFVRATSDTARLEFTDSAMRILIGDAPLSRAAVTAAITNGGFATDLSGWTDADESGATSVWTAPNYMSLQGTGFNSAIRTQTVTCHEAGTEHALRVVVARGPMRLRVGSTSGLDDYVAEQTLGTGVHSIAFTPAGNFVVYLANRLQGPALVDSVAIEAAGAVVMPTAWAAARLPFLRTDQSADVLYVCDGSTQQYKVERRLPNAPHSWSLELYQPTDGPFLIINASTVTITPSDITGDITLVASDNVFRATHVGALFRLSSNGQFVQVAASGENEWSTAVRITGVGNGRKFTWNVSGTYSGTVTVQSSTTSEDGPWASFDSTTGTGSHNGNDTLDNQIVWYRIGINTGDYVSGTAKGTISYSGGSLSGVVRISAVTDSENANATVLSNLGNTNATAFWYEGVWSDFRGWPSEVQLHEGRLWWFGFNRTIGSVSDAFESFDDSIVADDGPIQRTIGKGPVDQIDWSLSLARLCIGTDGTEIECASDGFGTPLTPTNFNLKFTSTQGSAPVAAAKVDLSGYFVQRSGLRLYEISLNPNASSGLFHSTSDLTAICYEVGDPGIAQIVPQRQPDTRIHCRRADGTVAVLISSKLEEVQCWVEVETDGIVEDICVLPGTGEDEVYYTVNRTINGVAKRYYEKWALETECRGGAQNKQADSFVLYNGAATNVLSAPHLIGKQVVVWADGKDFSPGSGASQTLYTVNGSGHITLAVAVSAAVIGLPYVADFESVKLAYAAQLGSALSQQKRIGTLAVIAADMHYLGLQYGRSLTEAMDDLPMVSATGAVTAPDTVWAEFDDGDFQFPDTWGPDERLCLRASAPRPCNLLATVIYMETNDEG